MKPFMDENFLLDTPMAQTLYHGHAKHLPIIDYHCHLNPEAIATDRRFDNLGQIWLEGDHYKWRAMRSNGVPEDYCTGNRSDYEKFEAYAATVPYAMRNPLYHWTHLELKTAFGIEKILKPETAREIFEECTAKLRTPEYSARNLMRMYNVETVCTTDDPVDSLCFHQALREEGFEIRVLPTWRPDRAMDIENPTTYKVYLSKLEAASDIHITNYQRLIDALRARHDYFTSVGCRLSDHGSEQFYAEEYTQTEINAIFDRVLCGNTPSLEEEHKFKSAILYDLALMDHEKGWVQQFHYGVLRNNNHRMFSRQGPDTGFDSIGQFNTAQAMSRFFNKLDLTNQLTKTILYNINPSDNEMIATMIGNFQDGLTAGKMQFGSGWWFLDQELGMIGQMNSLSVLGLLSRFIGMLTDSRSFLSYPRHEYFRRILCNLLGNDVKRGALPKSEMPFIEQMVENICYYNAKHYFNFD